MKTIFRILSIFVLLCTSITAFSQEVIDVKGKTPASEANWKLLKHLDQADIYYSYVNCNALEVVNLKLQNLTEGSITIAWEYAYKLDGEVIEINPDDAKANVQIQAKGTIQSTCDEINPGLAIIVAEGNGAKRLTSIELTSLTVSSGN